MRIGIDFDNTIVCYDRVFHDLARHAGLIPNSIPVHKQAVRDYMRDNGLEDKWTEIQGIAYGKVIHQAKPFPGALRTMERLNDAGSDLRIISHKTRTPYRGEAFDLREAALSWLDTNGFFDNTRTGLSPDRVAFAGSKDEKLQMISSDGCGYFIDDLCEFLSEPNFPPNVHRIWFNPDQMPAGDTALTSVGSWLEVENVILAAKAGAT